MPRRARYLVPRGLPRRDEFVAVCVVLIVLAHALFAQLTILIAAVFYLITRTTRWRLSWLTGPAVAGLAWTAAAGPRAAAAGFAAGAAQVADYLGASGHQADHLLHFTAAFAGAGTWLPRPPVLAVEAGAARGLPGGLAGVGAAAGGPLLVFGGARGRTPGPGGRAQPACCGPFRPGVPARRAGLVMAMLSWDGPGRQYRRSCL